MLAAKLVKSALKFLTFLRDKFELIALLQLVALRYFKLNKNLH